MRTSRSTVWRRLKQVAAVGCLVFALCAPAPAAADTVALQDYVFNVNGSSFCPDSACGGQLLPTGLDTSGFDFATGLGTLIFTFDPGAAGTYFLDAFFDHELHDPFFNEYGAVSGAPAAGVSWQIDEPGFGDGNRLGTIFDNTLANTLDNTDHVPGATSNFLNDCGGNSGGAPDPSCNNDVSLAMGFNFILSAGEEAVITLVASSLAPSSGFYLQQVNPDSRTGSSIFLSGSMAITSTTSVPEPGTLALLGTGVMGLWFAGARRRREVLR